MYNPLPLSESGTCGYDKLSFPWFCYIIWQKKDFLGWASSNQVRPVTKSLNVRDEKRSSKCSPVGLKEADCYAVERAMRQGTAGTSSSWGSQSSDHQELNSADKVSDKVSALANTLTLALWNPEQRVQLDHAWTYFWPTKLWDNKWYCSKPLSLGQFVMQYQKTNTPAYKIQLYWEVSINSHFSPKKH